MQASFWVSNTFCSRILFAVKKWIANILWNSNEIDGCYCTWNQSSLAVGRADPPNIVPMDVLNTFNW